MPHSRSVPKAWAAAAAVLAMTAASARGGAEVLSEDELEGESTELGAVLRGFSFVLAGDVLTPPLNAEDASPTGIGLFDLRAYFAHKTPELELVVHNQFTTQARSHEGLGAMPIGRGVSPSRWLPLTFHAANEETVTLTSAVDWLYAAYLVGPVSVTLGRQPVTFGRGRLWRTADCISAFALTEVDTEYKPGADAVRIDWTAAEQTSVTALGAVGELESASHDVDATLRGSSFVARVKQGWDGGELGLLGGFVRNDAIVSVDAVFDVGEFDVYGELTMVKLTDQSLEAPALDDPDLPAFQALAGATFRPSDELTIIPELYLNSLGAWQPEDYLEVALSKRVAIGQQTALGMLYAGVSNDWQMHPLWYLVYATIANLRDPSALVSLAVRHNLADNVEVQTGGYLPVGRAPELPWAPLPFPVLQSEYGSYPYFFFAEVKGVI